MAPSAAGSSGMALQTHAFEEVIGCGLVLQWVMEIVQWWQLRRLCRRLKDMQQVLGEGLALLSLHGGREDSPHGGKLGVLLTQAVRGMIRHGDVEALQLVCFELRRRGAKGVPWTLHSRELVLYAAANAASPEPLQALFAMAPHAVHALSTGDRCNGHTAMHEAAFCGKPWNIEVLLAAGCSPRVPNRIGETALHIACLGHRPENAKIARQLIDHDPELLGIADHWGAFPLDRLWQALARWLSAERRSPTDEERGAIAEMLQLLDPCGASLKTARENGGNQRKHFSLTRKQTAALLGVERGEAWRAASADATSLHREGGAILQLRAA